MATRCQPSMKSGKGHMWQLTAAQQETGENKHTDIFWTHCSEHFKNAYETQCWLMNLIFLCIHRKNSSELQPADELKWWFWYPTMWCLGRVAPCPPVAHHTQCTKAKDSKGQKSCVARWPPKQPSHFIGIVCFFSPTCNRATEEIFKTSSFSFKRHHCSRTDTHALGKRGQYLHYLSSNKCAK